MNFKNLKVKNLLILSSIMFGMVTISNASEADNSNDYSYNSQDISEDDKTESKELNNFKLMDDASYQEYEDRIKKRKKTNVTRESKDNEELSSSGSYDDDTNKFTTSGIKPITIKDKVFAKQNNACVGANCNKYNNTTLDENMLAKNKNTCIGENCNKYGNNNTSNSYVMSSSSYYSSDMNGNKYSSYSNYQNQSSMKDGELVSSDIKAGAGFNDNGYTRDADVFSKYNNKKGMDAGGNAYENGKQTDRIRKHYNIDESKDLLRDGTNYTGKKLLYAGLEYLNKSLGYDPNKCLEGDTCCSGYNNIEQDKNDYENNNKTQKTSNKSLINNKHLLNENYEYDQSLVTDTVETKSKFAYNGKHTSVDNKTIPLLADKPAFKEEEYRKFPSDTKSDVKD